MWAASSDDKFINMSSDYIDDDYYTDFKRMDIVYVNKRGLWSHYWSHWLIIITTLPLQHLIIDLID